MSYDLHYGSVAIFAIIVILTLILSFVLGSRARTASGFFAADGGIHWFVNGVAFAGDYLSAASFLGICGMIAFYGYDGFLYSIGYLAGWIVALLVVAEPLKRMGRFTFADALNQKFESRGVQCVAALSTLTISIFYLIPQMVGAGVLIQPLLGLDQHWVGVVLVGAVVIAIVVTAGMVSTTYVQFLKGGLLLVFSLVLVVLILMRGFVEVDPQDPSIRPLETQTVTRAKSGEVTINGLPRGTGPGHAELRPIGHLLNLPGDQTQTGPVGPVEFFSILQQSEVVLWKSSSKQGPNGESITVYTPHVTPGNEILRPGNHPAFQGIRSEKFSDKLNFLSLMLALFCGTASLPHILIRYYTVKDQASARKSTIVGIAAIGSFYLMTLYLGLGAMTSGALDVTDSNMAAPLLARSFGDWLFAVVSAVAFTTVLGTVSGLILAGSGAVVHDLMSKVWEVDMSETSKVRVAKIAAMVIGAIAVVLGILFAKLNVNYLVGWAFSIAASANLPSLVMLLFWRGTTKQGIIAAVLVGMFSSLGWILLSADTYKSVYQIDPQHAIVPFSQPGIVTIPLGFAVLIVVSLLTRRKS